MWDSNVFFERDNFINFDFSINLKYVHIFREIFFVKVILVIVVIGLSLIHVFVCTDQLLINMKIENIHLEFQFQLIVKDNIAM